MDIRYRVYVWPRKIRAVGLFLAQQFLIALIGIFAASSVATILAWITGFSYLVLPLLAFSFGIGVASVIWVLAIARSGPTRWILKGYRIVSAEYTYTFDEADIKRHTQNMSFQIESLRRGVSLFENRYSWTGRGQEPIPRVLSPGQTVLSPIVPKGTWKYYYIDLGRELSSGERTTIKIEQQLYDSEGTFLSILGKHVMEPSDELRLRVKFPVNVEPFDGTVFLVEMTNPGGSGDVLNSTQGTFHKLNNEIVWSINNPHFGHHYQIQWKWNYP